MAKNPLVIICGPTATRKTSLGIKLAKKFSGELVSADSRQVYRGMDIGTGKDLPVSSKFKSRRKVGIPIEASGVQSSKLGLKVKNFQIGYRLLSRIPIWLVDIIKPNQRFSVSHWVKFASLVIEDIWKRGKIPIIVGGTGFYLKGLIQGFETLGIPPDWQLRKKLSNKTVRQLREILKRTCPERMQRMNKSDRKNPRRLVRAIEVARQVQSSKFKVQSCSSKLKIKNILIIGLKVDYKTLYQRIDRRVEERLEKGIVKEIKDLLKKGYSWNDPGFNTLGYKEFKDYFEKKVSLEEVIQRWKYNEHTYARRQMTWFRGQKDINWFDITKKGWQNKIGKKVYNWL